jgi:phage terminase small subunit
MVDEYGLTPKQRSLADNYLESGNATQSALIAYNTTDPSSAAAIASKALRKDNVQAYIAEQCKIAKVTVPRVLMRLSEELDAERTLQTATGEVLGKEPDFTARHRAIETAIKYAIPEFVALRQGGGEQVGSQHLHLHGVQESVLRKLARKVK